MIEHCISAFRKQQRDLKYRVYVTDALKDLIEIQVVKGGGKVDYRRFFDLINDKPQKQDEPEAKEETAEDVIARITDNLINMGK